MGDPFFETRVVPDQEDGVHILPGAAQRLTDGAEYKRRQAPPGVKITDKAFGRDRRYPITNAFREM